MVERLARFRVTLGFVFGGLVLWLASPTRTTLAVGVTIAVAGEAIRIWAAGHLNKSREVTDSGPYRFVAHPLYLGSSVMGVGLAVACGSAIAASLIAVYLVATLGAAMRSEEAFLRAKFGERYDDYRRGGSASGRPERRERRRFSAKQARANREPRTMLGLGAAILLLVLKATYNGSFGAAAAGR